MFGWKYRFSFCRKLNCPFIVKFYGAALHKEGEQLKAILVMELCKENLMRHIFRNERNIPGRSSTATAARNVIGWAKEIANALKYIHRQGIVHRDLKLENILVSSKLGVLVIVTIFNYNHLRPSRLSRTSSNSNSLAFTRFSCFLRGIPVADHAINSLESL